MLMEKEIRIGRSAYATVYGRENDDNLYTTVLVTGTPCGTGVFAIGRCKVSQRRPYTITAPFNVLPRLRVEPRLVTLIYIEMFGDSGKKSRADHIITLNFATSGATLVAGKSKGVLRCFDHTISPAV
jgi:hypothetical protein